MVRQSRHIWIALSACLLRSCQAQSTTFSVPVSAPTSAVAVDSSLLSVSIEFFAFPGYTQLQSSTKCLSNIQNLRGAPPAIRIGGTTQDRATYDASLTTAVNYSVSSPLDAPLSLTYGPSFFTLAGELAGDVTIGLNRELNNIENTRSAAEAAVQRVKGLLAIELGNEPDLYSTSSPIASGSWSPSIDGASQKNWFTSLSSSVGNIFQGAVYLQYPSWSTAGLIPILGDAISFVKTFSGHSYPQSACGGASTNLQNLISHSGIVSYTSKYSAEAKAAHAQGKPYFLGETNSATCGGGGISPTFGAGLWVMDYVLQGALAGVDRLYFHQGTIGNCAYCFWNTSSINAPYFGAYFVSEFLGSSGSTRLIQLDSGSTSIGAYAVFPSSSSAPARVLLYNSNIYSGSGTRSSESITLSGLSSSISTVKTKRLSAPSSSSLASNGVVIGSSGSFGSDCSLTGTQSTDSISVANQLVTINVPASEAVIVYLTS
ncbi:glycoside hydrolase family 79 [Pyrrhoderma noxium]|uniref:Glycoside hydrolase family 79 n=1 Tax=Pyrrhoderma noxium TaxID=2282107 RepID=A0A286UB02_9AGAM|nr:glycoside hydrolase family 79 [Pyrrhoderma noxium]